MRRERRVKKLITNKHLEIMQQIVSFVQELGWDIDGIEIVRYTNYSDDDEGDEWKEKKKEWKIDFSVAPRKEDAVMAEKKEFV